MTWPLAADPRQTPTMPDRERAIVFQYLTSNATMKDVGRRFGITANRVVQILNKANRRARWACVWRNPDCKNWIYNDKRRESRRRFAGDGQGTE